MTRPSTWSRRAFSASFARLAGVALAAPFFVAPSIARAATAVRSIKEKKGGFLIELGMDYGPFPHRSEQWTDDTTFVYVPKHFRVPDTNKVDTVVHFHGHRSTAAETIKRQDLLGQLMDSKQNAILVVPQGPVNASSSAGGKLEGQRGFVRFLGEVRKALQLPEVSAKLGPATIPAKARIGAVAISAYSGGFYVAAQCLKKGGFNVNEVYLFDAMYGERAAFRQWVLDRRDQGGRERHKLICYYTKDKVKDQSMELMAEFDAEGISYRHEKKEGQMTRRQMTQARVVFIHVGDHMRVTHSANALRDCLYASCFKRRLSTDWFDDSHKKRKIDKRG